jgi:carboxyl-terminal processing protease
MRPLLLSLATLLPAFAAEDDPVAELLARVKALDGVADTIAREHADPVDRDRLWAAARAGMVAALDPDSAWLDRGAAAVRAGADRSRRDGYGFDWRPEDGTVTRVVPAGPAAGAGLRPGDRLLTIDGRPAAGAARRLAAEQVTLTWTGADGEHSAPVHRGLFADSGVVGPVALGDGVGLVRIHRFLADPPEPSVDAPATPAALARAIDPAWRALVLDLRGCGGGHLGAAVASAGAMLPAGLPQVTVARQVSANQARDLALTADGSAAASPALVVLVDAGTGSAGELLAAALRHHRKAVLAGARTMGKDTVQQVFLMPEGDALLLTIARLRDPAGRDWARGLEPDVPLDLDEAARLRGLRDGPAADPALARARDLALAARGR